MQRKVPTLSLSDYKGKNQVKFIDDLFIGLKEYGFIVLKDHPISESLLSRAYKLNEALFNLDVATKSKYILTKGKGQRGYTPFGVEHAKDSKIADLKEFWHVGREISATHRFAEQYPMNVWPAEVPEFKKTFSEMYSALDECGKIILEALTVPLELSKNYFSEIVSDGNSILRLLHYPPLPPDRDPRAIRAAPHEDINLITILVSASASGLQLKDRNGKWLDIESEPNSLIVDAGDMLARITNDVIPSTTHQVVNPPNENSHRYSMPFFMHPNPDAMLSCLPSCRGAGAKYPDILSQDFLNQRLREIGLL